MPAVSHIQTDFINVVPTHIKRSTKFTCIGWISELNIPDDYPLVLFAVSDRTGVVISDDAIRLEIKKYKTFDYQLQFSNSISKPINQMTGIDLNDDQWHFISYICNGEGIMNYYVDGEEIYSQDSVGDEGIQYSIAWSRSSRLGGGNVWVPYLYRNWQNVNMYNWRYGNGINIHQAWIQELMNRERLVIEENS